MVSIIACTIRDSMMENIFNNFDRQLWREKELIIILNNDSMEKDRWEAKSTKYDNVSIYQLPQAMTLGDCLNFGIEKARYEIVAKLDDDDYYSEYYFNEAMLAIHSNNSQLIGKERAFLYFEEQKSLNYYEQLGQPLGGTIIFKKEVYQKVKFPSIVGAGTDYFFLQLCKENKINMNSTSEYNYVYIRKNNSHSHTWNITNNELSKRVIHYKNINDYIPTITKKF